MCKSPQQKSLKIFSHVHSLVGTTQVLQIAQKQFSINNDKHRKGYIINWEIYLEGKFDDGILKTRQNKDEDNLHRSHSVSKTNYLLLNQTAGVLHFA